MAISTFSAAYAQSFSPPPTPQRPVVDTLHGVALTDPYQWLEDKSAPEVKTWTRAQHDATLAWLDKFAPQVPGLREDLARYVDRTIVSAPTYYKSQEYFTRKQQGEAQAKLFTKVDGKEVLLFDPVALDPSGKTSISTWAFSRHDDTMSVSAQQAGSEIDDTYFIDRRNGKQRFETQRGITGVSFSAEPNVIFFTKRTKALIDAQKPLHAYRMQLGESQAQAAMALENDDAKNWVGISESERSTYTLFQRGDFWSRTFTVAKINDKSAPQVLFSSKKSRAEPQLIGHNAYLRTNQDAPNWKLLRADLRERPLHNLKNFGPKSFCGFVSPSRLFWDGLKTVLCGRFRLKISKKFYWSVMQRSP